MQKKTYEDLVAEIQELHIQLEEAQETLNAIKRGEIDGLVISTQRVNRFTPLLARKSLTVLLSRTCTKVQLCSPTMILCCIATLVLQKC